MIHVSEEINITIPEREFSQLILGKAATVEVENSSASISGTHPMPLIAIGRLAALSPSRWKSSCSIWLREVVRGDWVPCRIRSGGSVD